MKRYLVFDDGDNYGEFASESEAVTKARELAPDYPGKKFLVVEVKSTTKATLSPHTEPGYAG